MNRVCKILGIEKPIIQGPMAWISTAPLVAAAMTLALHNIKEFTNLAAILPTLYAEEKENW